MNSTNEPHKNTDAFKALSLEKFWKIERDILIMMDWKIDQLLPYDFSEAFQELGIMFSGDTFQNKSLDGTES
jgi:hypothetical protein